jgi:hypothetical protein
MTRSIADWPADYVPTESEIREREAEFKQALCEAKELVDELEQRDMAFFWKHGRNLPQPPRTEPQSLIEKIWAGEITRQLETPILRFDPQNLPNEDGSVTFEIKQGEK